MDTPYHITMLSRVLGGRISARALQAITAANLGQDGLAGLVAHPEYHFDDSLFERSLAYVETCRREAAKATDPAVAWAAFGRLSHAVQDFYAHSNYVRLWAERAEGQPLPPPEAIDGLDPALLRHPRLISGRVYWPLEALWIFPALHPWLKRVLPADSHANLNLDTPATGPLFDYAIEAAVQRTYVEFERTLALIGETQGAVAMRRFLDLAR